jgi:hypothetical protein
MKYQIAAALALMLTACATSEGYRQQMTQLVGRTQDVLLVEFGSPDSVDTLSDGGAVWSYMREQQRTVPGGYRTIPNERRVTFVDEFGERRTRIERYDETVYEPSRSWWVECETRFVIDPEGVVRDFRFVGDACVAEELY